VVNGKTNMADTEGCQFVRDRIRNCILNILRQMQVAGDEGERMGNVHFRLEWLLNIVTRYYQTDLVQGRNCESS
jgi:hypothetical protein